MTINRLALGSAQFGLNYGINNHRGQIDESEVLAILTMALDAGVNTIDTASAYGNSEEVLGKFLSNNQGVFKVISKLPKCEDKQVRQIVELSLSRLHIPSIYGYLLHNFESYKENSIVWEGLEQLKKEGKIEKIGMSFYFPSDLDEILRRYLDIDIVQVPFSIFDQRFMVYFKELKKRNIEIHVRSVFLQGLLFKNPFELPGYFSKIKEKIERLHVLAAEINIPLSVLCVSFAFLNDFIDKVIIGVDNLRNLKEIISTNCSGKKIKEISAQLFNLREDDEKIILPFNWNLSEGHV